VLLAIISLPLVTLVLTSSGSNFHAATALSSYLLLMVAAIGGVWPGLPATATGFLLSNYEFVPPVHPFTRSPVHPFTRSPVHPSTRSPVHPFTRPPVHPCTRPPVHPSTRPPVHPSTRPPVHPSTIADDSDCDVLALPMVLATGGVVNVLMDLAVRRAATAARVAGRLVSADRDPLPGNSTN
jgi:hypothetical protein